MTPKQNALAGIGFAAVAVLLACSVAGPSTASQSDSPFEVGGRYWLRFPASETLTFDASCLFEVMAVRGDWVQASPLTLEDSSGAPERSNDAYCLIAGDRGEFTGNSREIFRDYPPMWINTSKLMGFSLFA